MHRNLFCLFLPLTVAACAAQQPGEQVLQASPTVRLCQGGICSDQPRSISTRVESPVNQEAELKRAALEQRAEHDPKAAYDLGLRYMRGDGVERDSYQAIEWMRKAGDAGVGPAQLALGRLYLSGFEEMGPDPSEAFTWLSLAADQGMQEAKLLLPKAAAAKQRAHSRYQAMESDRKSWNTWLIHAPYFLVWSPSGWHLR